MSQENVALAPSRSSRKGKTPGCARISCSRISEWFLPTSTRLCWGWYNEVGQTLVSVNSITLGILRALPSFRCTFSLGSKWASGAHSPSDTSCFLPEENPGEGAVMEPAYSIIHMPTSKGRDAAWMTGSMPLADSTVSTKTYIRGHDLAPCSKFCQSSYKWLSSSHK